MCSASIPNPTTLESNSVENLIGMPYLGFKRFRKDPQVGGRTVREGSENREPAFPAELKVRDPHAPRPKRQKPREPRAPRNETRAYRRLPQTEPLIEKDPRSAHALVPKGAADHERGCAEGARESRIHLPRLPSNAATILRLLMRPLEPAARDPSPMRHLEPAARDASPMRPFFSGNPRLEPCTNLDRAAPSDRKAKGSRRSLPAKAPGPLPHAQREVLT